MRPMYHYYYYSFIPLIISSIAQLLAARAQLIYINTPNLFTTVWFVLLVYHLPLATAVTIGLVITWRYWSWLVTERNG